MCSSCPRLYIVVVCTINTQLLTVGFEPRSCHTAVRHVTARPLQPAVLVLEVRLVFTVCNTIIYIPSTYYSKGYKGKSLVVCQGDTVCRLPFLILSPLPSLCERRRYCVACCQSFMLWRCVCVSVCMPH